MSQSTNTDPTAPEPFTTPDGRTVEDLVAHQFDDMIVDLDRASAELLELMDIDRTKLQRMRQEDPSALRGNVAHDLGTIATVLTSSRAFATTR